MTTAVPTSVPVASAAPAAPKQGRVTAYQATDGQLFTDRKLYLTYQRNLVAGERLQNLAVARGASPELAKAVGEFYFQNIAAVRDTIESKDISMEGGGAPEEEASSAEI